MYWTLGFHFNTGQYLFFQDIITQIGIIASMHYNIQAESNTIMWYHALSTRYG
jgi:hypothetical protein